MKIICVGRNYVEHIEELNNERSEQPLLFIKPGSSILPVGQSFFIPEFSKEIHHEVEVVIRICKTGKNISEQDAHAYYNKIGLGIDFTARDVQKLCKEKGWPWEIAKGFDGAAVIGDIVEKEKFKDLENLNFSLEKNGVIVQEACVNQMIWKIDELVSYISKYFTLCENDLIFTGTPAGVSKVTSGDRLCGRIDGQDFLNVDVSTI